MGDCGQLGNQEELSDLTRKRLPSRGDNLITMKSRVNREVQARCCERLEVQFLRPTRQPGNRDQPAARESQAGLFGAAEGIIVPMKPGNAGGGKDPYF